MYQVVLFDSSKGNEEGKEIEKVIAWYPSDCTQCEKVQSVGLLQALIQFSGVFDEVRCVIPSIYELCGFQIEGLIQVASNADIVEFERKFWVLGQLSKSNLYLSIMDAQSALGRHVSETNLMGLVKNFDNVLKFYMVDKMDGETEVCCYGKSSCWSCS